MHGLACKVYQQLNFSLKCCVLLKLVCYTGNKRGWRGKFTFNNIGFFKRILRFFHISGLPLGSFTRFQFDNKIMKGSGYNIFF